MFRRISLGLAVACCACSGPLEEDTVTKVGRLSLTARTGVYTADGRHGFALLVLLRDSTGRGPAAPLSLVLRGPMGQELKHITYDDSSESSFLAMWWPDIAPETGTYTVQAFGADGSGQVSTRLHAGSGLGPAIPTLSPGGERLAWEKPEGALAFRCTFTRDGVVIASTAVNPEPGCDLDALGEGLFSVSAESFSVDLLALARSTDPAPSLLPDFHVSSSTIGFARDSLGATLQLRAALGRLEYGPLIGGSVVWLALGDGQGRAPVEPFHIELTGPGISSTSPIRLTYPAGQTQLLWPLYDLPLRPGTYGVRATASNRRVATSFSTGDGMGLPIAQEIYASALPSGSAQVDWKPVPGANSYRVSVWEHGAAVSAAVATVTGPPARFGSGTLATGRTYQVYVLATDVELTSGAPASGYSRIRASENAYAPATLLVP